MQTKVIYKIRHKVSGEWKYQGMSDGFSSDFYYTGDWNNLAPIKAVLGRIRQYYNYYATENGSKRCKEVLLDMDNWEVVSYNVSAEEVGVIDLK